MNPFFESQYGSETSEIYNPFSGEGRDKGSLSSGSNSSSSSSSAAGSTNRRRTSTLGADSELKPFTDLNLSGPSSPSSSSSSSLYVGLYPDDDGLVPHSNFDELDICGLDSLPILVRVIEAVTTAPDVGKNYTVGPLLLLIAPSFFIILNKKKKKKRNTTLRCSRQEVL